MSNGTTTCQSSSCINGNPPSTLECPTCSKLGIRGSFFCGQECFKAGWVRFVPFPNVFLSQFKKTHKIIHNLAAPKQGSADSPSADGTYNPFPNFRYTGTVRPAYPLSPRRVVPEHIPRPDYANHPKGTPILEMSRAREPPRILSLEEQEKLRTVCKLAREVLDIAASHVKPGITTDEIDEVVHKACIERDSYPSPLNYRKFPKSVCTSINEVICHGIPDKRKLREGDIINIDVTLYHNGFHADLNATYPVGKVDDASRKLMRTARECLDAGIAVCKPGALWRDIGKAIEPIAKKNQCSTVRQYTGHGINDLFHPTPNIPHYAKNKAVGSMKPGMAFTIEPMINMGNSWDTDHWPDDWTSTTVDGERSAQFEETLLITETGVEILTKGAEQIF